MLTLQDRPFRLPIVAVQTGWTIKRHHRHLALIYNGDDLAHQRWNRPIQAHAEHGIDKQIAVVDIGL